METAERKFPNLKIESSEIIEEGSSVGRGAFGEVIKASRPIYNRDPRFNGHPIETLPIAIKFTKDDPPNVAYVESMYLREIDLLSRFKHSNIVSLMGYFERLGRIALVYHYAPNKSHDCYIGGEGADSRFTWAQRLKICIGVARGLEYLHRGGVQKIKTTVHRDIKSANILLDRNWEAIIGDFGLSIFAKEDEELSNLKVSVAGTPGYQDPHYLKSEDLSEKVDVYSFGVLLYEVLSGKIVAVKKRSINPGVYPDHGYESSLPQLRTLRNQLQSMFDFLDIEGKYINLLTLTGMADKCLEDDRYKRPEMIHIVEELEKLLKNQIRISNLRVSFLDIEKATENFKDSNMIKWGESARLYKGEIVTTHGSKTVAIKRLNGGVKQEEEVNFLIEILTLSDYKHPNIIDLHGFHCDENTKIVIYEYAFHLSLDKYLSNTSNKCCFTWKQFLKICFGAAQGLEFIHTFKPGDGIVHGDVKASNILITRYGVAKISNFGLRKRTHKNKCKFLTSSGTGTLGYCDPRYMETGLLTKESDVYAFGLVLFEVWGKKLVLENDWYYGEQVNERKNPGNMKPVNKNEQINSQSLSRFLAIARKCVQENPEDRPKMGLVVQELGKALSYAD